MKKVTTTDIARLLMSLGCPPELSLSASDAVAELVGLNAKPSASVEAKREKWRLKKQRQRAARSTVVPGDKNTTLLSSISQQVEDSVVKKVSKTRMSPGDKRDMHDVWPEDHLEQFWQAFPVYRREAKIKVGEKLVRLRRDKIVTWERLIEGVRRFAATNPGQYAPAPMRWLNEGRWDREYHDNNGGSNGNATSTRPHGGPSNAYANAARRRVAPADGRNDSASGPAAAMAHVNGPRDAGGGPRGSAQPTFDLELDVESRVDT